MGEECQLGTCVRRVNNLTFKGLLKKTPEKMKTILGIFVMAVFVASVHAQYFSDAPDADAFVRAVSPSLNYGAAGALAVSGSNAVNGVGVSNGAYDTFIRFNTAALTLSFNSLYGSNNWVITHA